ncbi:MAG: hypothetical protein RQ750_12270 [Roseovarius sp.]|nr:hypothetical protein [Roseovarius sp.]
MMPDDMQPYREYLTGGREFNVLHAVPDDTGNMHVVMFMMDAEFDPCRVLFGPEGDIIFPADNYVWPSFTASQLRFIAYMAKGAAKMWADIWAEELTNVG